MDRPPRVTIVGGGIGGLAAALALKRMGADVLVFERARAVRELGAGLSVWSNALRALAALEVRADVVAAGSPIDYLVNTDWRGRVLQRVPVHWFGQHVAIQRPQLLQPLLKALGEEHVRTAKDLVGIQRPNGRAVVARFTDGSEHESDLLIGADGLFSTTRQVLGEGRLPSYSGQIAWRGIASFAHERWPVGAAYSAMGCGKHFAVEPLIGGRLFWYATADLPAAAPAPPPELVKTELLAKFSDCHSPVPELIEATSVEHIVRNRVYDLPKVRRWSHGRVALLGDAAHAMRPNLGQGACLAIEDAVVLATCVANADGDLHLALRRYERTRRTRARWIVFWSKFVSELEHIRLPVGCAVRDWALRMTPGPLHIPWLATILRFTPPPSIIGLDHGRQFPTSESGDGRRTRAGVHP